ncbi:MAG: glycosyltransferase [Nitrospiraceae bacterium]
MRRRYGGRRSLPGSAARRTQTAGPSVPRLVSHPDRVGMRSGEGGASEPHGLFGGFGMRRWLEPLLETIKPDVVHYHCLFSPVSLAWLCKRVPTVFTLHSLHLLLGEADAEAHDGSGAVRRLLQRVMRPALRQLASWIAGEARGGNSGEGYPAGHGRTALLATAVESG